MGIQNLQSNEINQNGYHKNILTQDKIGALFIFPNGYVPNDCLACDGYILKILDYSSLYNIIGKDYNKGDEKSDEFRIPDYNISGRFLQPGTSNFGAVKSAGLPNITDSAGNEISYLDNMEMDLDVGDTNDFEAVVNFWDNKMFSYNNRIYIPETEYGGIIGDREIITKNSEIVLRGYTWRGLLSTKVIIPPKDSTNLILSGEINAVVRMLIGDYFGNLFYVPDEDTKKSVSNYSVDRFTDVASAIYKLLDSISMRLNIRYDQDKKAVELKAVDVLDYSEELEYSQDNKLDFDIRDCRNGVNHLICGGSGQGLEREIIHLYVQQDGSIGDTQYYFGLNENAQFYDYANAESTEKLQEIMNKKTFDVDVEKLGIDAHIGDIVGGRDYLTGMYCARPIENVICCVMSGKMSKEYELEGENDNGDS